MRTRSAALLLAAIATGPALAQWDPTHADWGKSDQTDLRVMTWNILDGIAADNTLRDDSINQWNALVRIVAAMQPDVLFLQECGNGDSQAILIQQVSQFLHGGPGTPIYVQFFEPDYDLPYIFVSSVSDSFNRNVILSRYPFADINGDSQATASDFFLLDDPAAPYEQGGNGGIRGFMFAEIDLPDEIYAGDLVAGTCHLKAFGDTDSFNERVKATGNIAYFLDAYYNGMGTGVSDPNSKVILPSAGNVLDANTPIVWGGDWNQSNYSFPATTMWQAGTLGGSDGTDRDRSDCMPDFASHPISGETSTQSGSKLDYIVYQDSIATLRRSFVFRSSGSGVTTSVLPYPVNGFPGSPGVASGIASDHRPVIVDLILPAAAPAGCNGADLAEPYGQIDFSDVVAFLTAFATMSPDADLAEPFGQWDFSDIVAFLGLFGEGCP
ncbi:MAG: GC-type dockerin domain-anchored protein [Phycisphaerales bacterium]